MLHKALQNKWARVLIAVFATFLYALGVNLFVVPMGLRRRSRIEPDHPNTARAGR